MSRPKIDRLLSEDRSLLLNYDYGLEAGPVEFNINNMDPEYVINIAANAEFNGLIVNKGIAEHYYEHYRKKVPIIIKLNAKTNIPRYDMLPEQICSINKAVKLGAAAV